MYAPGATMVASAPSLLRRVDEALAAGTLTRALRDELGEDDVFAARVEVYDAVGVVLADWEVSGYEWMRREGGENGG
jgi:hypothetical protein